MKRKISMLTAVYLTAAAVIASAAEIRVENGAITASGVPEGSMLMAAVYRDGILTKLRLYRGSGTITADDVTELAETEGDTVRAFLWDMESLYPVCEPLTAEPDAPNEEENKVIVTVNEREFTAVLYENETAQRFKDMLPMTITMNELNGNEKYFYFDTSLPTDSESAGTIHEGDLMLYGSSCLVLFYETFQSSYSYTRIGYIEDTSGLKDALGSGDVVVTYDLPA